MVGPGGRLTFCNFDEFFVNMAQSTAFIVFLSVLLCQTEGGPISFLSEANAQRDVLYTQAVSTYTFSSYTCRECTAAQRCCTVNAASETPTPEY